MGDELQVQEGFRYDAFDDVAIQTQLAGLDGFGGVGLLGVWFYRGREQECMEQRMEEDRRNIEVWCVSQRCS